MVDVGEILRLCVELGPLRIAEMARGDALHPGGHRGREQRGLPVGRQVAQDGLDLGGHTDVEHLVDFVEHYHADVPGADAAAFQQVERTARRGHHDLGAGVQRLALGAVAHAAQHSHHPRAAPGGQRLGDRGDLLDQLARGSQDQRLLPEAVAVDVFKQRQHVGQRLAGAGAGLAHHVHPGVQEWDAGGLDGRGFGDGLRFEMVCEVVADAKVRKAGDERDSLGQARAQWNLVGARCRRFARAGHFAARGGCLCRNHTLSGCEGMGLACPTQLVEWVPSAGLEPA